MPTRRTAGVWCAVVVSLAGCGSASSTPPSTTLASTTLASVTASALGAASPVSSPVTIIVSSKNVAQSTSLAERTTGPQPASDCQQIAFDVALHHPGTSQVVVVATPNATATAGTLQVAQRTALGWACTTPVAARVGRAGTRPLLQRRSGDGTTPAGVFPLGVMTAWDGQVFSFFGNSADPGVAAGGFRRVKVGDCFGATPNNTTYGHLVFRARASCPGPDDEYLPAFGTVYERAALIGANMEPHVSGDAPGEVPYAAAIFLHRNSYDATGNSKATSGCVSLSHADLIAVLTRLRAGALFAIGDTAWLLANS